MMIRKCIFLQNAAHRGDCEKPSSEHVFNTRNVFGTAQMKALQTYHLFSLLTDLWSSHPAWLLRNFSVKELCFTSS